MRRRLLSLFAIFCGLLFFLASTASAQGLRAEKTFYIKPRVGLSHYWGDVPENFTFGFGEDGFPYSLGFEFGYHPMNEFSISVQSNYARYPALPANMDHDRITHELLVRWTARASTARVAPFIQGGLHGTDGVGDQEINLGPSIGVGLDIALSDRLYLFLEALTRFAVPDESFDGDESEDPSFDLVSYIGPGLKWNFKRAFTPVDVMNVECPDVLAVGESGTFTATVNTDRATPPVSYSWNWGDGTSGTGSVATRSFNRPGTYTVRFTASNNGRSDTETCVVRVEGQPVAAEIVSIDASDTRFQVCEPVEVEFEADVRGDEPMTFQWDFGDGSTGIGEETEHTYTEPGTYTVTLTVSNPQGRSTRSLTITAEPCTVGICYEITEMNSVFFGRNSSTLTAEARAALRENLDIFEECPNLCAEIIGFAAPGERNPHALSHDRARAVEQYYVDNGIAASRFVTEGRGQVGEVTSKKEGTSQFRRVDTIPVQCVDLD